MMQEEQGRAGSLPPEWQDLATKEELVELRARLDYMATKEDLAKMRGEFAGLQSSQRTAGWPPGLVDGLKVGLEVGLAVALMQLGLFFLLRLLG